MPMTGPAIPDAFVSCTALQTVSWVHGSACAYTDPVAVFRFLIPDGTGSDTWQTGLQPHEISRAQRFHRQDDRDRFGYTRRLLRILVGNYTRQDPSDVCFTVGINQKPEINGTTDWHMNVSHSGNSILVAIGKTSVGVDIEKINPDFTFQDVLSSGFSPEEQRYIVAGSDSRLLFYQLWTRKEALVKATAKGLDDDFFRIPSLDGNYTLGSDLIGAADNWTVMGFMAFENYPAAVAYRTGPVMPKFYTLDSGLFGQFES